jgi:ABC-type antimicrobial peptide transport system permease subunit
MYFALRSSRDPVSLAAAVEAVVRDLDPNLPVTEIGTQTAGPGDLARERVYAQILTFFGALALGLAIGLSASWRIRWLSAPTRSVESPSARGATWSGWSSCRVYASRARAVLGLGAALALGRTVASLVYGIPASDPVTLAAVSLLLLSIAALAAFVPARRAARVDPIVALRTE